MRFVNNGANYIALSSLDIDTNKDFKGKKIVNLGAEGFDVERQLLNLRQTIHQVHPTIQVLGTIDESTYSAVKKDGNTYTLLSNINSIPFCVGVTYTDLSYTRTNDGNNGSLNNVGYIFAGRVAAAQTSNVISLSIKTYATGGGNIRMALYSDNAGMIGALLAESASVGIPSAGWSDIDIPDTAVVTGTYYWVMFQVDNNDTNLYQLNGGTNLLKFEHTYGAFPNSMSPLSGNVRSAALTADSAILSFYNRIKLLVSNGTSSHATPVQVEIYGSVDSYASPLNATKFTIDPADPQIVLKRNALDTITASSDSQTVWNMTVAGGLPSLAGNHHGTILATEIGVASILAIEMSILGTFLTDLVVLTEYVDYDVDYSTPTATKITLKGTAMNGIVGAQSKIRLTWIADVMKIEGGTNNTALKVKIYLNRTSSSETSPDIEPIPLGSAKYVELEYGT